MANRYSQQFQHSYERELVHIYLKATVGASGAITLSANDSRGVTSITKETTAGQYTVLLADKYSRLMACQVQQTINAGALVAPVSYLLSADTTSAKTLVVQFQAADGATETNPADTTVLNLHITLSNVAKS